MLTNSVLTPVLICQDSLSHPAILFEIDPELKLAARHESLLCPCACSWSRDQQSAREMVEKEQQGRG